ncbi:hypothetical protein ANCDUO_19697 [Ancylostoma duodenale]|uniref:Class II aldolase/adducin N-terminal domain-containing protein n=1 Tax=Ancylostoma duodenale TaxID=51022 RepID=A0A0C2FZF7_9BILA|nr:hypothetical protein ANCDUO_19697 [Ancylostoma duodenale]
MSSFVEDANFMQMSPDDFPHAHDEEAIDLELFVQLMGQFYENGWMRGTGGALGCIAHDKLFISPSALQKERLRRGQSWEMDELPFHTFVLEEMQPVKF